MNSKKLSREIVKLREEYEGNLDIGVSRRRVRELRKGKKLELHQLYLITRIAKAIGNSKIDLVRTLTKEMFNCVKEMSQNWENFSADTKNKYCEAANELDFDNLDPKATCMKTMKWAIYSIITEKESGFEDTEPTNHEAKEAFRNLPADLQKKLSESPLVEWTSISKSDIESFLSLMEEDQK